MKQKLTILKNVSHYTEKEIMDEINECRELLYAIGFKEAANNTYDVRINHKPSHSLGRCSNWRGTNHYIISINKNHIKYSPAEHVHATIMHEVLHTMDGCMNHGPKWKRAGEKVNKVYQYSPITTTTNTTTFDDYNKNTYKYIITCCNCGSKSRYMRKTRTVTACLSNRASCSCGSRQFKVERNF